MNCSKLVLSRRHILAIGSPQPKFSLKKTNKTATAKKNKTTQQPRKVQYDDSLTLCMTPSQKVAFAKCKMHWCPSPHVIGQVRAILPHTVPDLCVPDGELSSWCPLGLLWDQHKHSSLRIAPLPTAHSQAPDDGFGRQLLRK